MMANFYTTGDDLMMISVMRRKNEEDYSDGFLRNQKLHTRRFDGIDHFEQHFHHQDDDIEEVGSTKDTLRGRSFVFSR